MILLKKQWQTFKPEGSDLMTSEEKTLWEELNKQYGTNFEYDDSIIFPSIEEINARMSYGDTFDGATQNYGRKVD